MKRTQSDDASRLLSRQMDMLESAVGAPVARTREGDEIGDSALFMDEDDDGDIENSDDEDVRDQIEVEEMSEARNGLGTGLRMSSSPESELLDSPIKDDEVQGSQEAAIDLSGKLVIDAEEAQALVARVTKVASELQQRYEETKHMNDIVVTKMESATNEVLHLKSENEALRASLSFDHSELLFLKLQLKGIELTADALADGDQRSNSNLSKDLADGIERWKSDWKDVDLKFKARRATYGMDKPPEKPTSTDLKDFGDDEHITMSEVMKAKLPKKIISIKRPQTGRSFTVPPPRPLELPTPSVTTVDEESPDQEEEAAILEQQRDLDADAITTSSEGWYDEEKEDEEDDDDDDVEARASEDDIGDKEADLDAVEDVEPEKSPWEELWDDLTAFVGMQRDD